MHVDLDFTTITEYAASKGIKIDYDETGNPKFMSLKESVYIQNILTCEVSIYLLRRSTGHCGGVEDDMVFIRRSFINKYKEDFNKEWDNPNKDNFY